MKHTFKIIALITALTISMTGCFPTGEKPLPSDTADSASDTSGNAEASKPFSGRVYEKIGDVELNYEIPDDFPKQFPMIRLNQKNFSLDKELIESVLFRDKTIVENDIYVDWVDTASDGSFLAVSEKEIKFIEGGISESLKHYADITPICDDFCRAGNEQLSSFSSAEAAEQCDIILKELGIKNYRDPYVITITPDMANEFFTKAVSLSEVTEDSCSNPDSEYIPWTEDDGLYILRYRFEYNGIDLCTDSLKTVGQGRMIYSPDLVVGVTKDGIVYFRARHLFDVVSLDEGNVDLKYDAKYASDQLVGHYSQMAEVSDPLFFNDIGLEYIPLRKEEDTVIFTPAWCITGWCFLGSSDDDENDLSNKKISMSFDDIMIYYYADTGRNYGGY